MRVSMGKALFMKPIMSIAGLAFAAAALAGCATQSVTDIMGSDSPATQQAQTYQDLSMPPDMRLPPPGTAQSYAAQPAATAPAANTAKLAPAQMAAASPAQPAGDIYERNGISKLHADGTPKTDAELKAELKQLYLAKKRQQDPNYGTVFNIGNIFSGG